MKRILAIAAILTLAAVGVINYGPPTPKVIHANLLPHRPVHAQFGAANVPGFFAAGSNAVVNTAIGSGGAVTNPATGFVVLVQGSTVYCFGSDQTIAQATITLTANTTFQIEWNCLTEGLYAKTAVTGPGSGGTSTGGTPPAPTALLFPIPGVEIPLATVVCGTTSCGNGGNGSITDARPVGLFPGAGLPLNTTLQANLPSTNVTNGTMIFCTDCTTATACTGAGTGALAVRQNAAWKCF